MTAMGAKPSPLKHSPKSNRLLAALPEDSYQALERSLEPVSLPLGMVVYESGGTQGYVYFPTSSIVSLLYVLAHGASAEIAVTGNEGLVGIALFMGGETTPSRAVVQSAGHGFRLRAAVLKKAFEEGGELQHLLLRYTQALITQMTQTAVCNRHHSVDQQLCRWLLLSLDRLPGSELVMTQELIANMLGRAPRGRHRGRRQAPGRRADPLQPRPHHRHRPQAARSARLRMLRGGEEGIRPAAAGSAFKAAAAQQRHVLVGIQAEAPRGRRRCVTAPFQPYVCERTYPVRAGPDNEVRCRRTRIRSATAFSPHCRRPSCCG
jgi:CRP-like cAMP-binding protein